MAAPPSLEKCREFLESIPNYHFHNINERYFRKEGSFYSCLDEPERIIKAVVAYAESNMCDRNLAPYVKKLFAPEESSEKTNENRATMIGSVNLNEKSSEKIPPAVAPHVDDKSSGKFSTEPETADDIKSRIYRKLIRLPQSQRRYERLLDNEKAFILRTTGFTHLEKQIFLLRCEGYLLKEIEGELPGLSLSRIKKMAISGEKQIRAALEEDIDD